MNSTPYGLLFVSSNRLLAESIGSALINEGAIESQAYVRVGQESQHLEHSRKIPALVVFDGCAHLEEADLFGAIQRVKRQLPSASILVLGSGEFLEHVTDCIVAGANTYVSKGDSLSELAATVKALREGKLRCSKQVIDVVLRRIRELSATKSCKAGDHENQLTEREIQVLELVEREMLNKEIAHRLGIAISTVKNHLHAIFEKFGVTERRQAVRKGLAVGVLHCQQRDAVA